MILVAIMLIVLFFLVVAVLHMSVVPVATNQSLNATQVTQILDFRKNILAIIITAFGAWIGAGAAYFFGRENQREASSGESFLCKIVDSQILT